MNAIEAILIATLAGQTAALLFAINKIVELELCKKRMEQAATRSARISAVAMKFRLKPCAENFAELRRSVALNSILIFAALALFTVVTSSAGEARPSLPSSLSASRLSRDSVSLSAGGNTFAPPSGRMTTHVRASESRVGTAGGALNFDQCGMDGDMHGDHNAESGSYDLLRGHCDEANKRKPVQFRPLVKTSQAIGGILFAGHVLAAVSVLGWFHLSAKKGAQ